MSWAVGIDVSTKRLAFATVTADGGAGRMRVADIESSDRGARRLARARACAFSMTRQFPDAYVYAVEVPFTKHQSFALMGIAAVVLEAVQAAVPDAVVLEVSTGVWKKSTVGFGNATKDHVMGHAHDLGYAGDDQDLADALCIAEFAHEAWVDEVRRGAA